MDNKIKLPPLMELCKTCKGKPYDFYGHICSTCKGVGRTATDAGCEVLDFLEVFLPPEK